MADEDDNTGGDGGGDCPPAPKCEVCIPGLPGWMATFSDLVTLLLTFFVLLLSFAKTESAKYEAALGSIRNAFGGNVLKYGEVIQRGKSPDDSPTMMETADPIRPFPIDFLTMEGLLDKHEINRESTETLDTMKEDLGEYSLNENADVFEMPEGIKVAIKDKIYYEVGSATNISQISIPVFDRIIKLLSNKDWTVFVQGHAHPGEVSADGKMNAFQLSAARSEEVTKFLIKKGVRPEKITSVFYGDSRPIRIQGKSEAENNKESRRVEFIIRKTDLNTSGHKVDSQ